MISYLPTLERVLEHEAKASAVCSMQYVVCTHNRVEGIKGAQGYCSVYFLGEKWDIQVRHQKGRCGKIRLWPGSNCGQHPSVQHTDLMIVVRGSVPEAIIAFLDGTGFEDTLRLAVSLGGDSDTQAAILPGSIAQTFYGEIPSNLNSLARNH